MGRSNDSSPSKVTDGVSGVNCEKDVCIPWGPSTEEHPLLNCSPYRFAGAMLYRAAPGDPECKPTGSSCLDSPLFGAPCKTKRGVTAFLLHKGHKDKRGEEVLVAMATPTAAGAHHGWGPPGPQNCFTLPCAGVASLVHTEPRC